MANTVHEATVGSEGEFRQTGVAGLAISSAKLHLDELVIVQGAFGFDDDSGRYSGSTDEQHRIQHVTLTS
jgi:hypothetical protein